jgi:hypothetical protein
MNRIAAPSRTAAAGLALLLALGACSSSTTGSAGSSAPPKTSSAPASSTPASTSAAANPTGLASGSGGVTTVHIAGALLRASDLGPGFTEAPFTDSPKPLPCGKPGSRSFNDQVPAAASAGRRLDAGALSATFSEEIRVYADSAGAQKALAAATAGLNCATGTLYGTGGATAKVTISKPQEVGAALNIDVGRGWRLKSSQIESIYLVGVIGRALLLLAFTNAPSADTTKLPDPQTVTKAAIAKIKSS